MERIAYPGEAALWELDWPDREPAVGRLFPSSADRAHGLQPPILVSRQAVQHENYLSSPGTSDMASSNSAIHCSASSSV